MALFNLKNSILALSYATFTSDVQAIEAMSLLQMKDDSSSEDEEQLKKKHSHASIQVMKKFPHTYGRSGQGYDLTQSGHPTKLQGRNPDAVYAAMRMSTTAQNGADQGTNTGLTGAFINNIKMSKPRQEPAFLTGQDLVNDLTGAQFGENREHLNARFQDFDGHVNMIAMMENQSKQQRAAQESMNRMPNGQRQEGVQQYESYDDDNIIGGACHTSCEYSKKSTTENKCYSKKGDCTACVVVEKDRFFKGFGTSKKCQSSYN